MENDKWTWFAGGVVLGLLLGLGIAGGYSFHQIQRAKAETARHAEEVEMLMMQAEEARMRALDANRMAEFELERMRKSLDQNQKDNKDR